MNQNLLEEIKRMNNLMGVKPLLLEAGKQTYQLIDNTIGWKKVGEFFDNLFDGVGRRSGNNGADEVADMMRRESDENFRKSYGELRIKTKAELQSYADTLSKKLERGLTNFTPNEKSLLGLLEKFAQTQQDAKTIRQEIPIIKQKVAKNLAGQERYTMVSDSVYEKVVNELETKISNGEKVTQNDLLDLYRKELDNLKRLDINGNPIGDLLPSELKEAMVNRLKTQKNYKDFVNSLSKEVENDADKIDLRRVVNGQEEKLGADINGVYNDVVEKDFDTELVDANKELTRLKNELSKETDGLKKIDLQREIELKESQIKVLQKEKEFKTAVDDWVAGKSKTSTDVNRLAREVVNNREATEIMEDPLLRVFPDAAVGNQTTWSDYFIGFTDFIRGRKCSYNVCKVYQKWWDVTGMNFFMNVIQNLAKTLDDILRKNEENFLGFGNYSRLRDPEFFKKQYQEIINEMQEIATRKEKGWESKLQLQRDRLMRLIETRRPQTDDPNWKRLISSTSDLQDQANTAIDNAWKEIKDSLRQADMKDLPGMKGLYEWMETKNAKGKDFFDTMEAFFTKFKDSITTIQTWFSELMPWMKKADGSYEKLMQKKVGVSDAEGDQISKEIADATKEGVEKGGKATKEGFSGAISKIFNWIINLLNNKFFGWMTNYCRYGLFTNLNMFKQILMRHGYIKGMVLLYLKIVIGAGFVKAVGFLISSLTAFLLESLISVGMDPATAQAILLWVTHPIESVRASLGNKDSKLYLLLESDRMREEKNNFLKTLFSKFADADNFKVYPFVEEFVNMFTAIFGTISDFKKGNTQVKDLNDDLSVIGGAGPNVIRLLLGTAISYGNFVDNDNSNIYNWEEGLKQKLDEYMKDVDKLRKSSLKDVMGEDWDKLVLSARQKKLETISPYIGGGCYNNDLVNLLKVKIDINPKFTKPLTEVTLDKSKTVDNNQKLALNEKISKLVDTKMRPVDDGFNTQFSDIAGLVIGQDFYRIERGPTFSDGTSIPPANFPKNVVRTANSGINEKCCTFMDPYIKKEGDTTWYCLASPKVMEMIGGSSNAKEMVSIEEEIEAKKVFYKIIDGTSTLEKQKMSLEQKWEDVKFWVESYEKYLNYTKNNLYNKARFKNTLMGAKIEIGLTAKKAQEIKKLTKEWQDYINNYLDKTKTVRTKAMDKERESFYSRLKSEFGLDVDANGHIDINKWFENYNDEKLEEYVNRGLKENMLLNKNIINERYLLENKNMRSRYIFENDDEQRFGENKFDHWYDTFTFQKYDEKSGEFKDIETDSLKHGKIKERFNDFIKNYDGDDAFVRAVVDTHPEVLRFKYLKDQANIQETYYPTGLASILSVIRESKGEYEIFSVSRQKGGNWNLVKGDFTQKEMSNMVLTKQIPPEKKPKERENGLESLKKKEATGTNSLRNDEKEGLKNLPKKVKEKVQEKISRGWTTELPPKIFKDFYEESEVSSVFNEKIPIYKLEATPEFFRSLQKNSSHVLIRRGFCRSLLMAKNDSDIDSEQRKVVNHVISKCEDKFEGKFGLRYLSKKY